MEDFEQKEDWQADVRRAFAVEPTVVAMQRHLLFTMRSTSVRASEAEPGRFRTTVDWDGTTWEGTGATEAEALGRVLIAMSAPGSTPLPTGFEDRTVGA